jgi:hypothetical protein
MKFELKGKEKSFRISFSWSPASIKWFFVNEEEEEENPDRAEIEKKLLPVFKKISPSYSLSPSLSLSVFLCGSSRAHIPRNPSAATRFKYSCWSLDGRSAVSSSKLTSSWALHHPPIPARTQTIVKRSEK